MTKRVVNRRHLTMADQEFFIDALSDELLAKAYFDITGKLTKSIFKLFDVPTLVGPALLDAYVNLADGRDDRFRNLTDEAKRDKMLTRLHAFKESLPAFSLTADQRDAMKAEMTATDGNGQRCPFCFNTVVPGESQVVYNDCRHFLCMGCHSRVVEACDRENRQHPCYTCRQGVIRTRGFTVEAFVGSPQPITVVPPPNIEMAERRPKRVRVASAPVRGDPGASTSAAPAALDAIRRMQQDNMVLKVHNAHQTVARENAALVAQKRAGEIVDRKMREERRFDPDVLAESMLRGLDDPLGGLGLTPACAWTDEMDAALAAMNIACEEERNRFDPDDGNSEDDE